MEKISSTIALTTLIFSELYLLLYFKAVSLIRKLINKLIRYSLYIGMTATVMALITGFVVNHNATTSKVEAASTMVGPVVAMESITDEPSSETFLNVTYTRMDREDSFHNVHNVSRGFYERNSLTDKIETIQSDSGEYVADTTSNTELDDELENDMEESYVPSVDISRFTEWTKNIGQKTIETEFCTLVKCGLPSDYGNNIDFSTFKPYEDYRAITNKRSAAYRVTHSTNAYNDRNGYRRYSTNGSSEFTVNNYIDENGILRGDDDYVVAMGTYYIRNCKEGQRFLIVGENGMFTVKIGDEKADQHTDSRHMYSFHGKYGGLIEFIVNTKGLEKSVRLTGSVNSSSVPALKGKIKAIYRIDS